VLFFPLFFSLSSFNKAKQGGNVTYFPLTHSLSVSPTSRSLLFSLPLSHRHTLTLCLPFCLHLSLSLYLYLTIYICMYIQTPPPVSVTMSFFPLFCLLSVKKGMERMRKHMKYSYTHKHTNYIYVQIYMYVNIQICTKIYHVYHEFINT